MEKNTHIKVRFGERVRFFRKIAGLTQEQLAERANLHPTYIGQVERGERNLSLICIEKLANGLSVEIKDLFTFPAEETKNEKDELLYKIKAIVKEMDSKSLRVSEKILKYLTEIKGK
ncbi:MAG: hypothetical protein B5M53_01575 [Candidatus Cloacimonas sp. 4484_209]|nr:MAG: hypothetical protein B5M53_01575 [Candidatus Cloacimonas sp. 4484_209]